MELNKTNKQKGKNPRVKDPFVFPLRNPRKATLNGSQFRTECPEFPHTLHNVCICFQLIQDKATLV